LINISNIFGGDYEEFIQTKSILFEVLEIFQPDELNFEIKNSDSQNVNVVIMFSEDLENFNVFSNLNSSAMGVVLLLVIFGFLLILDAFISIIGIIVMLVEWKNVKTIKEIIED